MYSKLKFFQKLQFFILTEKLQESGFSIWKKIPKYTKFFRVETFEKKDTLKLDLNIVISWQ